MRTRFTVLAALLCGLAALAAPVLAGAAPRHDRGLTISAAPNPIIAGEGVIISGLLQGPGAAGRTIYLYHRINPASRFSLIGRTTTDIQGHYRFTRAEGIVMSNRSWFVRGPNSTHSSTVHERVAALVTLHASTASTPTGRRVVFWGALAPRHPFERVLLQQQVADSGNGWRTIASTFTNRHSHFALAHRWARPGTHTLRAFFVGDRRNVAAGSDSVTLEVQQREKPAFTLNSSSPVIDYGQTVDLTGTLEQAGTTTPEGGVKLTLLARIPTGTFHPVGSTTTASDGTYQFTEAPLHNTVYRVVTARRPWRSSAPLNEGVRDLVTINSSSATAADGGSVTISGTVAPSKSGHVIFLQRLGDDGAWHDVARTVVSDGSIYSFTYTFGQPGTAQLRARIYGGPWNVGAASPTETVVVSAP